MVNELPAKFIICKKIQAQDPIGSKEDELWDAHNKLQKEFTKMFKEIAKGEKDIVNLKDVTPNFLSVKVALAEKIVERCTLCERKCYANRKDGEGDIVG